MDRETEELPAASTGRGATRPLPEVPANRDRSRHEPRQPAWLAAAALALLALAAGFVAGLVVGRATDAEPPAPPRIEAAPPPTRDAVYCGRALDVSARLVELYRAALENRVAAARAGLERNLGLLQRLDAQLRDITRAADGLEGRVTRALATCPS